MRDSIVKIVKQVIVILLCFSCKGIQKEETQNKLMQSDDTELHISTFSPPAPLHHVRVGHYISFWLAGLIDPEIYTAEGYLCDKKYLESFPPCQQKYLNLLSETSKSNTFAINGGENIRVSYTHIEGTQSGTFNLFIDEKLKINCHISTFVFQPTCKIFSSSTSIGTHVFGSGFSNEYLKFAVNVAGENGHFVKADIEKTRIIAKIESENIEPLYMICQGNKELDETTNNEVFKDSSCRLYDSQNPS